MAYITAGIPASSQSEEIGNTLALGKLQYGLVNESMYGVFFYPFDCNVRKQ